MRYLFGFQFPIFIQSKYQIKNEKYHDYHDRVNIIKVQGKIEEVLEAQAINYLAVYNITDCLLINFDITSLDINGLCNSNI